MCLLDKDSESKANSEKTANPSRCASEPLQRRLHSKLCQIRNQSCVSRPRDKWFSNIWLRIASMSVGKWSVVSFIPCSPFLIALAVFCQKFCQVVVYSLLQFFRRHFAQLSLSARFKNRPFSKVYEKLSKSSRGKFISPFIQLQYFQLDYANFWTWKIFQKKRKFKYVKRKSVEQDFLVNSMFW